MDINAKTKLYCIFGNPVKHSLSPIMHNASFLDKEINGVYLAFQPEKPENIINSVKTLNIKGASVTIPFKTSIIEYLDEVDELASHIGAVNTIVLENSIAKGYNTDGLGALEAIKQKIDIDNKRVLVIGTGGSSRAICFTLLSRGMEVTVGGRGSKSHSSLYEDLKENFPQVKSVITSDLGEEDGNSYDIVINTTPLGMKPDSDPLPVSEDFISGEHIVFDIVYAPHLTPMLKIAQSKGCEIIFGRDMLIYQGAEQFKIWNKMEAPVDVMRNAIEPYLEN